MLESTWSLSTSIPRDFFLFEYLNDIKQVTSFAFIEWTLGHSLSIFPFRENEIPVLPEEDPQRLLLSPWNSFVVCNGVVVSLSRVNAIRHWFILFFSLSFSLYFSRFLLLFNWKPRESRRDLSYTGRQKQSLP